MKTKFQDFKNEGSFFHSEEEINEILDKLYNTGKISEGENLILLNYSKNDEPIREILLKMKELTEQFKELNELMKKTGDKKLMDKWLKLNDQMTIYENKLRYGYKIEDPILLWQYEKKYL